MGAIITDLTSPIKFAPKKIGRYPSFNEFRHKNPVVAPDKGFTKQLKKLNKDYEVIWDWGSEKWEIWKFEKDKQPVHITTIQTKDKTYRQLGADVLLKLQQFSFEKYTAEEISNYLIELENQERRRRAKDFKNKIESIARESFNYARGVLQVSVPDYIKPIELPKSQIIGRIASNE